MRTLTIRHNAWARFATVPTGLTQDQIPDLPPPSGLALLSNLALLSEQQARFRPGT